VVKSRESFKFWRAQAYPWNGYHSQATGGVVNLVRRWVS